MEDRKNFLTTILTLKKVWQLKIYMIKRTTMNILPKMRSKNDVIRKSNNKTIEGSHTSI